MYLPAILLNPPGALPVSSMPWYRGSLASKAVDVCPTDRLAMPASSWRRLQAEEMVRAGVNGVSVALAVAFGVARAGKIFRLQFMR